MTILENMALADNKGKMYGLLRGTNKNRISYYREQLSRLNLGLEDKMECESRCIVRWSETGDGTSDVNDDTD